MRRRERLPLKCSEIYLDGTGFEFSVADPFSPIARVDFSGPRDGIDHPDILYAEIEILTDLDTKLNQRVVGRENLDAQKGAVVNTSSSGSP